MDTAAFTALAQELSRDEFSARFPHLFLVFNEDPQGISPLQFATQMVHRKEAQRRPTGVLRVLPVVKAPSNPYSDRISVGRARNCDVVLRDPSVSKLHAHVRKEQSGTWVIIDLDSYNGTAVAGTPILPSRPEPVRSGDLVTFGAVTVRVLDAAQLHLLLSR